MAALLICTAGAMGQKYSARLLDEKGNMMYFFDPTELKDDVTVKKSGMVFDVTLLTDEEMVTVNMTLASEAREVETVRIMADEDVYETGDIEVFYQEKKGSEIRTRLHVECPYEVFKKLFDDVNAPLRIEVTTERGRLGFGCKKKVWKRYMENMDEVFFGIDGIKKRRDKE